MEKRMRARVIPFVTALLAVPLVSHPRRDVCPGYPLGTASLLGHHRSYYRGQFLGFFGSPSAYVGWCTSIQIVTCHSRGKFGFVYLSVARRDVRDGCGSDLCSWQEISRAVWISHPTSDRVLGRLWGMYVSFEQQNKLATHVHGTKSTYCSSPSSSCSVHRP
jgi:hypothetical protein